MKYAWHTTCSIAVQSVNLNNNCFIVLSCKEELKPYAAYRSYYEYPRTLWGCPCRGINLRYMAPGSQQLVALSSADHPRMLCS